MNAPLVIDNRAALGGKPGLHAIIIGASQYPFLTGGATPAADTWAMGQLSSTASSANLIYTWLKQAETAGRLPAPLATCRLLLSPSPAEAQLAGQGPAATLDNARQALNDWRNDCNQHRDSVALFYFAGHGVQRSKEDAVLCFEDFRAPNGGSLTNTTSVANIMGGMSPSPGFDDIARTQFYFVDACRTQPEFITRFVSPGVSEIFDVALAGADDRSAPVFFASISNRVALALPGQQTLFSLALLDCLNGEAAEDVLDENGDTIWVVTVNSLNEHLCGDKLNQLNRLYGADQTYAPGGAHRPRVVCKLAAPPQVRVRFLLEPEAAHDVATLELDGPSPVAALTPVLPRPFERDLTSGVYKCKLTFGPGQYRSVEKLCAIRPRRGDKVRVTVS